MERDRRRVELLNSLLLSMPGTPTLYYGDEIGMGDNIYLGDRDGVRTPMQSIDRNGGFSRADPAAWCCRRSWTRNTATSRSTSRPRPATRIRCSTGPGACSPCASSRRRSGAA
jgi:maltose alpha-D-glucosyltransferase/alpha-amylase